MSSPTAFAYYTATKNRKFVTITQQLRPVVGPQIPVSGMVEARKVAAAHSAQCRNF